MRFEQIIAAVTRSLNIAGVREILSVDGFAHATDLQLCMACVSPGSGSYSRQAYWLMSNQPHAGNPSHDSSHAWLAGTTLANLAARAIGKRKRLPGMAGLLGLAKHDSATLPARDC